MVVSVTFIYIYIYIYIYTTQKKLLSHLLMIASLLKFHVLKIQSLDEMCGSHTHAHTHSLSLSLYIYIYIYMRRFV